jgi:hypothetical protein
MWNLDGTDLEGAINAVSKIQLKKQKALFSTIIPIKWQRQSLKYSQVILDLISKVVYIILSLFIACKSWKICIP